MSDETNRENEELEQTDQADPTAEEQELETDQSQEADQKPSESETDAEQSETNEVEGEAEPPKDNAAWAKLRVENKALKQAMKQAGVDTEYLNLLREANQPVNVDYVQQVNQHPDYQNDPVAQTSAKALQEVQDLKNELEFEQDKSAREKYSDLFADPQFEALVAEKKLVARILGKKRSTSEIAAEVAQIWSIKNEQLQAQTEQEVQTRLTQKAQATAQPFTSTSAGVNSDSYEQLSDRARRGDIKAQEQLVKDKLLADLNF